MDFKRSWQQVNLPFLSNFPFLKKFAVTFVWAAIAKHHRQRHLMDRYFHTALEPTGPSEGALRACSGDLSSWLDQEWTSSYDLCTMFSYDPFSTP